MTIPKTLCVDFDGVVHAYTSGWQGIDKVSDLPVPGALQFLRDAAKVFDEVCIYSSRSLNHKGVYTMQRWLMMHYSDAEAATHVADNAEIKEFVTKTLKWPTQKPPAFVTLDDRCVCFDGAFPSLDSLLNFVPWNKRPSMIPVSEALRIDDGAAP